MESSFLRKASKIGLSALIASLSTLTTQHRWAGRDLDDMEWSIHQRLALLGLYGVFDSLNFEVKEGTVTLSGQVVNADLKQDAETAARRVRGVDNVVNQIEVLPASQPNEVLRTKVYRSIHERKPPERYGTRSAPAIHIIVKNGWVSLEGFVDSEADRSMAYLRALKVTVHLSDNLRVVPAD